MFLKLSETERLLARIHQNNVVRDFSVELLVLQNFLVFKVGSNNFNKQVLC